MKPSSPSYRISFKEGNSKSHMKSLSRSVTSSINSISRYKSSPTRLK